MTSSLREQKKVNEVNMEIKVKYNGLEDRQNKVKEQEAKGLRMLYDNFDDPNWKHGDPIVGTITFTDKPPLVTLTETEGGRDLAAEIDDLRAEIKKLKAKLRKK